MGGELQFVLAVAGMVRGGTDSYTLVSDAACLLALTRGASDISREITVGESTSDIRIRLARSTPVLELTGGVCLLSTGRFSLKEPRFRGPLSNISVLGSFVCGDWPRKLRRSSIGMPVGSEVLSDGFVKGSSETWGGG